MKIYSFTQDAAQEAMTFIQYMNKLMGTDLWIYAENKKHGDGYYINFIRTYIKKDPDGGEVTRLVSHALYVDDIRDPNASPLPSSFNEFSTPEDLSRWLRVHEYDIPLYDMTACYRIYTPVDILTTDEIIDFCHR